MEGSLCDAIQSINAIKEAMAGFETRLQQEQQQRIASSTNLNPQSSLADDYWAFKRSVSGELTVLKGELQVLKLHMETTDRQIDDAEQYSRRNCLLLHGLAEKQNEDSQVAAISILNEKLNASLNFRDLDRVHRLGRPKRTMAEAVTSGKRPIIIKFLRYQDRDQVWKAKRILKGTGLLITESLTSTRHRLLQEARERFGVRNVWTQDGRIIILHSGNKLSVTNSDELNKITT